MQYRDIYIYIERERERERERYVNPDSPILFMICMISN
jgi:hypothetical protein